MLKDDDAGERRRKRKEAIGPGPGPGKRGKASIWKKGIIVKYTKQDVL